MTTFALIFAAMLALCAIALIVIALMFLLKLRRNTTETLDAPLPKAAILLALRGTDDSLQDCLRSLLSQNYPDYDLHIVVDSRNDPAWEIVSRVIRDTHPVKLHIGLLREPLTTCSRKCSALLQMRGEIDIDAQVVAFIDGDVVPHENWLKDLVATFADPNVGAAFGMPWYFPSKLRWGSAVRKVWNTPSGLIRILSNWLWGGTMALRTDVLNHPALGYRWTQALSSDTSVDGVVQEMGLRSVWVPSLFMPDTDECGFWSFCRQVFRYLLITRLYQPAWWIIATFVIALNVALIGAAVISAAAWIAGETTAAGIAGGSIGIYTALLVASLLVVDRGVRAVVASNGYSVSGISLTGVVKLLLATPVVHLLYLAGVIYATFTTAVSWRGVNYLIRGKWNIHIHSHN